MGMPYYSYRNRGAQVHPGLGLPLTIAVVQAVTQGSGRMFDPSVY
jgi:hypothetical protein